VQTKTGEKREFTDIGEAHYIEDLVHSLLSVSQLCKRGCTVVFKPSEAHITTQTGEVIPLQQEEGLYFLPVADESDINVPGLDSAMIINDPRAAKAKRTQKISEAAGDLIDQGARRVTKVLGDVGNTHSIAELQRVTNAGVEQLRLAEKIRHRFREITKITQAHVLRRQHANVSTATQSRAKLIARTTRVARTMAIMASIARKEYRRVRPRSRTYSPNMDDLTELEKTSPNVTRPRDRVKELVKEIDQLKRDLNESIKKRLISDIEMNSTQHRREMALARLWHVTHQALGHPSEEVTNAAVISGDFAPAIKAFQPTWFKDLSGEERLPPKYLRTCSHCMRGKFRRTGPNISKGGDRVSQLYRRARLPGELIHADLTGPFPESRDGNRYLAIFVDHSSRFTFAIPIKGKEAQYTGMALKQVLNALESLKGQCREGWTMSKPKVIRTDRGGEWTSNVNGYATDSDFTRLCKEEGIDQQFTSAGTSYMNGVAEGAITSVNDAWRTSLVSAGVSIKEWDTAALAAAYAINRRPTKLYSTREKHEHQALQAEASLTGQAPIPDLKNRWTTRYEKLTGLAPSLRNLLPYGCRGYVSNTDGKKARKDQLERSELVRYIGVPANTPGAMYQNENGDRQSSVHFTPDLRDVLAHRTSDEHMTDEDLEQQEAQLDQKDNAIDAQEQPTPHMVKPISDAEKRRLAKLNHNNEVTNAPALDRPIPEKNIPKGNQIHTDDEAVDIANRAWASGQRLVWEQTNPKSGVSAVRYEKYKSCTTFDDVFKAISDNNMIGSRTKIVKRSDLINDLVRGHVRIVDELPEQDQPATSRESTPGRKETILACIKNELALNGPTSLGLWLHDLASAKKGKSGETLGESSAKVLSTAINTARDAEELEILQDHSDTLEDAAYDYTRHTDETNTADQARQEVHAGGGPEAISRLMTKAKRIEHEMRNMLDKGASAGLSKPDLMKLASISIVSGSDHPMLNKTIEAFAAAAASEVVCGVKVPGNTEEAMVSKEADKWLESYVKELKALFDMGTFEYVRRDHMPPGKTTTKCKPVFKVKVDKEGNITKYKSREVVQGFRLRQGEDYFDTYSPTMNPTTFRLLQAMSVQTGERITGADVGNAYLEADMEDDQHVFVEINPVYNPEGRDSKKWVLKLKKCLYGMPHSGRAFGQKLANLMNELGYRPISADKAVYYKATKSGKRAIVGTYVDDIICMTSCEETRKEWQEAMKRTFHKVVFEDEVDWFLNMRITDGVNSEGMRTKSIDQSMAIDKIADMIPGIRTEKKRSTPMNANTTMTKRLLGEGPNKHEYPFNYASVVGALMYVSNWTRPDLTTAVNKLARYMADPTDDHYKRCREVVNYAVNTKHRVLTYTQTNHNPLRLSGASDSSFNDDKDTCRSTIGWGLWIGTYCSGMIKWASKVPKTIATSSTNAEVQAAVSLAKDTIWLRTMLQELGNKQQGSTVLYQDNDPAIAQIQDIKGTANSKHYLILLRKIQELLHKGIIHMNPIDTKENVADLFTKPLSNEQFWYLSHQATGFNDATGPYAGIIAVAAPKWVKALIRGSASLGESAEDEPKDSAMISAMINYCDYMNEESTHVIAPCLTHTCRRYNGITDYYGSIMKPE
jgi:hypothetical protein